MPKEIKLFAGNSNIPLAKDIAIALNIKLSEATVTNFSDGEINVQINANVRGTDVFVIQSTCTPVNNNLMELLIMVDALKRASAKRITAVMPYYGYARQDRKTASRVPISARLVADLLEAAGVDRVLTIDLHVGQIQGFFNIPVDHLFAKPVLTDHIKKEHANNLVIVSPDAGGVERARSFAKKLNASLAIIDKRREKANVSQVMHIIGNVDGKNAILLDDMIDTAGTITKAAAAIKEAGAKKVIAACAHAVLSGPALEKINKSVLKNVIVTNTIPMNNNKDRCKKLYVLSVASLLGEAIRNIHEETSVSSLFI